MTASDWDQSAEAWIEVIGDAGDWGRRFVLDAPMLARVRGRGFTRAVDVGCGEGRFCRMLRDEGIAAVGVDPTAALIARARALDPTGDYRIGRGEALDLADGSVDLAVYYLALVDIPDLDAALVEARRVLMPGGTLLIANLQAFNTASVSDGWTIEPDGSRRFIIDHYLEERVIESRWRGIAIRNHHRPLSAYLSRLLDLGFELDHFAEPPAIAEDPKAERYNRVPNFLIMEWRRS